MQDRIRSITHALGLRTILWGFDAFDWRIDEGNWHSADTDGEMWLFINNLTAGNFDTEGGIILTHELNNNTMTAAIKWLPTLKSYFSVRYLFLPLPRSHPRGLRNNADIHSSTLSPLRPRSTRRIRTGTLIIPIRRLNSVRSWPT